MRLAFGRFWGLWVTGIVAFVFAPSLYFRSELVLDPAVFTQEWVKLFGSGLILFLIGQGLIHRKTTAETQRQLRESLEIAAAICDQVLTVVGGSAPAMDADRATDHVDNLERSLSLAESLAKSAQSGLGKGLRPWINEIPKVRNFVAALCNNQINVSERQWLADTLKRIRDGAAKSA